MNSGSPKPVTMKLGSVLFLVLAFVLAVASGDTLLVLAVGSAIGGIVLLTAQRVPSAERRSSATPVVTRPAATERGLAVARARRPASRMAVRRYRSASVAGRRSEEHSHTSSAEVPAQSRVVSASR